MARVMKIQLQEFYEDRRWGSKGAITSERRKKNMRKILETVFKKCLKYISSLPRPGKEDREELRRSPTTAGLVLPREGPSAFPPGLHHRHQILGIYDWAPRIIPRPQGSWLANLQRGRELLGNLVKRDWGKCCYRALITLLNCVESFSYIRWRSRWMAMKKLLLILENYESCLRYGSGPPSFPGSDHSTATVIEETSSTLSNIIAW